MKFGLIDRVLEIEPAKRIVAVKAVSLGEEYLAEHFPTFPVLPGVFMLECMAEAAAWLVRAGEDFAHSILLLKSAKGVSYKSFVAPGQVLRVEVTCLHLSPQESRFSGVGHCGETEVVKGRFALTHRNVSGNGATPGDVDQRIVEALRRRWSIVYPESDVGAAQVAG